MIETKDLQVTNDELANLKKILAGWVDMTMIDILVGNRLIQDNFTPSEKQMFKFVRILEEPCEIADVLKSFMFNNLDFLFFSIIVTLIFF